MRFFKYYLVSLYTLIFLGCIAPFKKQLVPNPLKEEIVIVRSEISLEWEKIKSIQSDKNQIINLIGNPDFVDFHNAGEDWYYGNVRGAKYGLISFPVSGHLLDHAQYIKYPEWK